MTRTIKASEIKPGMEVEFTLTRKMMIHKVITWGDSHRELRDDTGHVARVDADAPVTVLSEPAPPQPEEPKAFGARVTVDGLHFVSADDDDTPWKREGESPWWHWNDLCELGPVTVIPDQGWTVPADSPEVPERIEEWDTWDDVPEGVVVTVPGLFCHYRKNQGAIEFSDPDDDPDWTEPGARAMPRGYGPWTRVTDA